MIRTKDLYDLGHTMAADYLAQYEYPWQALKGIGALITSLGARLGEDYTEISPEVWVHKTAVVAPTAYLGAPCIIGARTEVRHCAFIRGSALVGEDCVVASHSNAPSRSEISPNFFIGVAARILPVLAVGLPSASNNSPLF